MSAREEDTFAEESGEMEGMDEAGSDDDDEGVEMEEERADAEGENKVYIPGIEPLQPGVELEMDRSAYRMYHECQTGEWEQPKLEPGRLEKGSAWFYLLFFFGSSRRPVFELRRPERWRGRRQGAVPSVHAALCGNTSRHGPEQQVHAPWMGE